MKHNGSAKWNGGLKDGTGTLTTGSHTLKDTPYSFRSRFEDGKGTNPEELLGAAHAGCYSMALSYMLELAGIKPGSVATQAVVTLEAGAGGFAITQIHLTTSISAPGADKAKVLEIAQQAKSGCVISKALAAVPMTLDATVSV